MDIIIPYNELCKDVQMIIYKYITDYCDSVFDAHFQVNGDLVYWPRKQLEKLGLGSFLVFIDFHDTSWISNIRIRKLERMCKSK